MANEQVFFMGRRSIGLLAVHVWEAVCWLNRSALLRVAKLLGNKRENKKGGLWTIALLVAQLCLLSHKDIERKLICLPRKMN